MNKKNIIALSAVGMMMVGLSAPKSTQAFWPFTKPETNSQVNIPPQAPAVGQRYQSLSADQIQVREEHKASHFEERLQALVEFFGIDYQQVKSRLESGEKPRDIATDSDKSIEEWKEFRLETRKDHMKEMGLSEQEIQARLDRSQKGSRGQGGGMSRHTQGR